MDTAHNTAKDHKYIYTVLLAVIIMLQFIAALFFGMQKNGCHYDEYYSYYSSNVSAGLNPSDNGWMDRADIENEFMVLKGEGFNYGTVKLMQTYDVHPPLYYYILHTVCSLTPGVFSLWQGLAVNLFFHVLTLIVLYMLCRKVYEKKDDPEILSLITVALYGFSPAILSGVMFIRMYVLLSFLCILTVYLHVGFIRGRKFVPFCISVFVLTFLGTQTHYYFYVLMFFAAAFMGLYLLFKDVKRAFIYAGTVLCGIAASVLYYPSVLSHIFRGYRGTEATQAFFDAGNLKERAGLFVGLLDEYLLPHCFYILLLFLFIGYVTVRYVSVRKRGADMAEKAEDTSDVTTRSGRGSKPDPAVGLILTVTAGYFLVVLKTALTNAEEAVRYEMPVYGLLILLLIFGVYEVADRLGSFRGTGKRYAVYISLFLAAVILLLQISALAGDKVLFLYKDDSEGYRWAEEHHDATIVYIYNPINRWMIWDDSAELLRYDRIYFVSADNEDGITDDSILNDDEIYVYAVRSDEAYEMIEDLEENDTNVSTITKIRELQYADIYEIR